MQGLFLLHPDTQPQASWQLTAVLALMSGHWPARGLLSGTWPLLAAKLAPGEEPGQLLGSSDNESAPQAARPRDKATK